MRAQVGIIGAGPAGLLLSHLLAQRGIESVVLEARSRDHIEKRIRAGVLEQGTVDLLRACGVGERLDQEGLIHHGIELRFERLPHRIPMTELTGGRSIRIYGQQEVVKDLVRARLDAGGQVLFEAEATGVEGPDSAAPVIRYRRGGEVRELRCDVVAGCDGFHGVARPSIPEGSITTYEREYPFAWLGILAAVPPATDEITYCHHERGFAMHSMRSPERSRLYLQVDPSDDVANWPDERIWSELRTRLAAEDGWQLGEAGPILEKGISPIRAFAVEPMQYGRLFLAGDAAHIVPPTGAKGLNLAVADVRVLTEALASWYATGDSQELDRYTDHCLRRVWRAQDFATWMTLMLHRFPGESGECEARMQLSRLAYVASSRAAATSLAENYVGLEEL